jgi:hypothetical protein
VSTEEKGKAVPEVRDDGWMPHQDGRPVFSYKLVGGLIFARVFRRRDGRYSFVFNGSGPSSIFCKQAFKTEAEAKGRLQYACESLADRIADMTQDEGGEIE